MGNTFGQLFRITTWGESHGGGVGVVLDGCPPCIELSKEDIQPDLDRRRPGQSKIVTPRDEKDRVEMKKNEHVDAFRRSLYNFGYSEWTPESADDLAKAITLLLDEKSPFLYNICNPENKTIKEIAEIALNCLDANHLEIVWDKSKPDGQIRKDASSQEF